MESASTVVFQSRRGQSAIPSANPPGMNSMRSYLNQMNTSQQKEYFGSSGFEFLWRHETGHGAKVNLDSGKRIVKKLPANRLTPFIERTVNKQWSQADECACDPWRNGRKCLAHELARYA